MTECNLLNEVIKLSSFHLALLNPTLRRARAALPVKSSKQSRGEVPVTRSGGFLPMSTKLPGM